MLGRSVRLTEFSQFRFSKKLNTLRIETKMIKRLVLAFVLGLFAQTAFGQPEELQLAEDSRMLATETRTAAKDSRLECESLAFECQVWIAVVAPVSWAHAISFQSTLNVINKTRPTRSETEGEIPYSQGLSHLINARLMWQTTADEEATVELASMAIESYSEAESVFDEVLTNNEEKIELLQALLYAIQQFLGLDTGERSFV
jgi:hypothetical protein